MEGNKRMLDLNVNETIEAHQNPEKISNVSDALIEAMKDPAVQNRFFTFLYSQIEAENVDAVILALCIFGRDRGWR